MSAESAPERKDAPMPKKICAIAKTKKELPTPIIAVLKATINTPIEVVYFLPILSANAPVGISKNNEVNRKIDSSNPISK